MDTRPGLARDKLAHRTVLQVKLLDRQKRFFKRKRKLRKKKARGGEGGERGVTRVVASRYESEDECPGDSEESDTDHELGHNNNKPGLGLEPGGGLGAMSRKQCAKTRATLAGDQLENNQKGELVCLTCLKKFSNVQNLRYPSDSIMPMPRMYRCRYLNQVNLSSSIFDL